MDKEYLIKLEGKLIGVTKFEHADPPMGVIVGTLRFTSIQLAYEFFHHYCQQAKIVVNLDDPKNMAIDTQSIPELKVFTQDGTEIKSVGATISGMDKTGYEMTLFSISYPFYEYEFSHHVKVYKNKFK